VHLMKPDRSDVERCRSRSNGRSIPPGHRAGRSGSDQMTTPAPIRVKMVCIICCTFAARLRQMLQRTKTQRRHRLAERILYHLAYKMIDRCLQQI